MGTVCVCVCAYTKYDICMCASACVFVRVDECVVAGCLVSGDTPSKRQQVHQRDTLSFIPFNLTVKRGPQAHWQLRRTSRVNISNTPCWPIMEQVCLKENEKE